MTDISSEQALHLVNAALAMFFEHNGLDQPLPSPWILRRKVAHLVAGQLGSQRFSSAFHHGETGAHRLVYTLCDTLLANDCADAVEAPASWPRWTRNDAERLHA